MSFMAKSAGQKPTERVQGVLDDHLWHDSRSLNVSGIWSFFAPRSFRLNFLASPSFQELITLNWFDEIGSFSQSPKI